MKINDVQIIDRHFKTPKITVPIENIEIAYIRNSPIGNIYHKIISLIVLGISATLLFMLAVKGDMFDNVGTYIVAIFFLASFIGLFFIKYTKIVLILKGLTYRYDVFTGTSDDVYSVYIALTNEMNGLETDITEVNN